VEVVGHDLGPSPSGLDGRGVDLKELIGIVGAIILFGDVRMELGGPVDLPLEKKSMNQHAASKVQIP